MDNCLECGKPLVHVSGRRQKQFCSLDCRNPYYYRKKSEGKEKKKRGRKPINKGLPLPADFVNVKEVSIKTTSGEIKPIFPPKNLDELKSQCPKELAGFERSAWISTERQKYGI
jgi:hypothetical protein